jgi:lysyl-tRNA synthetase class 2
MLGLDLYSATLDDLRGMVLEHITGIHVQQLSEQDCLDLLMSQVIAKQFTGFTFVYDYPATQASLARIKQDNPLLAERFELFYADMELANGFSELTDVVEQRRRFDLDNTQRSAMGLPACAVDEDFLSALEQGLPDCAGVALGLDRLLMVMLEQDSIADVLVLDSQH